MAERNDKAQPEKVGSSPEAARNFAGDGDFGIPAEQATAETSREDRDFPGIDDPQHLTRSGSANREHGVGSNEGEAGHGSTGDIDTDFTGVSGSTVSAKPVKGHTPGPDDSTGSSDEFASGPRAKGENKGPPSVPPPAASSRSIPRPKSPPQRPRSRGRTVVERQMISSIYTTSSQRPNL